MHATSLDSELRNGVIHVVPETDGILAVCLEGQFDLWNAPALGDCIAAALETATGLIVDVSESTFIDSTVTEVFLRTARTAAKRGKTVVLQLGTATIVERTIKSAGVEQVLAYAHDRHQAVQTIKRHVPGRARGREGHERDRRGASPTPSDQHLHLALQERARSAVDAARTTVGHSMELAWLLGQWSHRTLTSRCAWCRRYRVGEHWLEAARTPPIPASRTTHTVCDDCTQALRDGN